VFLEEINRLGLAVFPYLEILHAHREDRLVVAPGHDDVHGHGTSIGLEDRNASLSVVSSLGAETRHTARSQSKREKA
jgi:hypothetical protein